ncbi:hypothetical protein GCK32_020463 [Trichostrongylus colubriformis]|uniref:Uncharacterized protein n=1 Tax=Trichostrongylus colubriformis TaxID=6319 RepID=A0AAN8IJ92_TRICO
MIEMKGSRDATADLDKSSWRYVWRIILDTEKCCNITYYHIGTWRAAKFRLAVKKDESISDYVESGKIFLPNFHTRSINFHVDYEENSRVHLRWPLYCFDTNAYKYRLV